MTLCNNGDVVINGEADMVMAETLCIVRSVYKKICEISEELGEDWLDEIPTMVRMSEDDLIEEIYDNMWEDE